MKKNKKQSPETPETSETPGSLVRYLFVYERHNSNFRSAEKNQKQTFLPPVRSETPVSQNE